MPYDSVISKTQFEDLEDEEFKSAVRTLTSCVSVVVVSRKGVFLSYHYESPGFSPSIDFSQIGSQEFFQEHVLNVIDQGGDEAPRLSRYTIGDGPLSAQYHPQAFVFMRAASGHAAYDRAYTNKVEQLAQLVYNIVGVPTQIQPYFNQDDEAPTDSPAGKIFFEYDPQAVACDPPKAGYRLWVEDSLAGHDIWDPLDSQKPE